MLRASRICKNIASISSWTWVMPNLVKAWKSAGILPLCVTGYEIFTFSCLGIFFGPRGISGYPRHGPQQRSARPGFLVLRLRPRPEVYEIRDRDWDWDLRIWFFETDTETDTGKFHRDDTETETGLLGRDRDWDWDSRGWSRETETRYETHCLYKDLYIFNFQLQKNATRT